MVTPNNFLILVKSTVTDRLNNYGDDINMCILYILTICVHIIIYLTIEWG